MKEKRYLVPPFLIYVLIGIFVLLIIAPPVLKMVMPKEEKPPVEQKKVASLTCQKALINSTYTNERVHLVYEADQLTKLTYFYTKGTLVVPNDQVAYQVGQLMTIEGAEVTDETEQTKIVFLGEVAANLLTSLEHQMSAVTPPVEGTTVPENTPTDLSLEGRQAWFETMGYTCQVLIA